MAQVIKELAATPDDLSWIPGNLRGGRREQTTTSCFLTYSHGHTHLNKLASGMQVLVPKMTFVAGFCLTSIEVKHLRKYLTKTIFIGKMQKETFK